MSLNRLVLVINASYEGINVVTARRAMTLIFKGAAVVEQVSEFTVRTSRLDIPLPSVIRLVSYRRVPRQNKAVSRKGILLRDRGICQYCGRSKTAEGLPLRMTLDHVIPQSRKGPSTWENLVTCCFPCNNRKGDRTPTEAGMQLLKQPRQISLQAKHKLMQGDEATWEKYLFS